MTDKNSTLIYLDTNSYSRPFDDQTQPDIQAKANAFLKIIAEVKNGKGDSVNEICDYWENASIDNIYNRVTDWKASQA